VSSDPNRGFFGAGFLGFEKKLAIELLVSFGVLLRSGSEAAEATD
jgi:hypothetical protein